MVKIGDAAQAIELGQETVLFRHEDKFHRPPAVALTVSTASSPEALEQVAERFKGLAFTRVGETLGPNMIALVHDAQAPDAMVKAAETLHSALGVPQVLVADTLEPLRATATGPLAGTRPLMFCDGETSVEDLASLAQDAQAPLCVSGDAESVAQRVDQLGKQGVKDVVISPGRVTPARALEFLTETRRAALKKKFRAVGCPVLVLADSDDPTTNALDACTYICKYAGVVVANIWDGHLLAPVLTTRQNIYTDPQKPVQVEPRLHEVGEVSSRSPLLVTTNFSLTYYSVESQVEASRVPCYILAVDTEGTSVLTSWASDKFNAETITAALTACNAEQKIEHRKLVLPGLVASLAASVTDESGWNVMIGPKEATGIGPFLKSEWSAA
jgi:acetyl-CoA decarbonylase/synthase complex subunit gamma